MTGGRAVAPEARGVDAGLETARIGVCDDFAEGEGALLAEDAIRPSGGSPAGKAGDQKVGFGVESKRVPDRRKLGEGCFLNK